jgi:uncharacterized protein (DUF1684 family)
VPLHPAYPATVGTGHVPVKYLTKQQSKHILMNRKGVLLSIFCFCLFLLSAKPNFLFSNGEENPMERREEKLKIFREKRDKFFKEDPQSPLQETDRKKFSGLYYYPINLSYAMVGSIERYPIEPKPIYANLPTSKGKEKKYVKYGRFKFKWLGKEYLLQIYRPLGGGDLFLPFKDKTSETETDRQGRYLHIETMSGGKVLIDFNRAYNPFCEYNEKYTCPFAPEENWLEIVIQTGEKRFR